MHPSIIDTSPKFAIGEIVKIRTILHGYCVPQTKIIEVFFKQGGEPVQGYFGRTGAPRGWHYICDYNPDLDIHEVCVFPIDPPEDEWLTEFKEKMKPQPVVA